MQYSIYIVLPSLSHETPCYVHAHGQLPWISDINPASMLVEETLYRQDCCFNLPKQKTFLNGTECTTKWRISRKILPLSMMGNSSLVSHTMQVNLVPRVSLLLQLFVALQKIFQSKWVIRYQEPINWLLMSLLFLVQFPPYYHQS